MSLEQLTKYIGADSVIAISDEDENTSKRETGWQPPPHFVPHLDKLIQHNREHPECRLGSIKIAAWLRRNGEVVGKDAVHRWLKKRSLQAQYEMQNTPVVRREE